MRADRQGREELESRGGSQRLDTPGKRSAYAAALLLALLASFPTAAQEIPGLTLEQQEPAEADPTQPAQIAARQAALDRELAAADEALARTRDEVLRKHIDQTREALGDVAALLRQQAALVEAPAQLAVESSAPAALSPSVFALDRLHELQSLHEKEEERRSDELAASRRELQAAKDKLDEAQKKRREARADWEGAPAAEKARAQRTLELRQLASRVAQERVHLRALELDSAQRLQQSAGADPGFAEQIAKMRELLARGEGDSSAGYANLTGHGEQLRRSREAIERSLSTASLRLESAQKRFSLQGDPSEELLVEVEARTVERDAIRKQIELIDSQLERLSAQRETWRQWETLLRGQETREELESWEVAVGESAARLKQAEERRKGQIADLERRLDALQSRLRALPTDATVRDPLEEERVILTRLLEAERVASADVAHEHRLSARLLADIRDRAGRPDLLAYARSGMQATRDLWSYEITTVDDSAITTGSLVLALLLGSLGLWASRLGSGWIARVATNRLKVDPGAAQALQTLAFYLLLVGFTLLALRAVHFPLTAFTVLGGALAIGIGFGSQNVMNNFISGLILMLERPVRARDVVEVDGNYGTIENIGARSTQIRSHDGRHIIVPNSFFLENNVVNWTLSDDLIRTSVVVGVMYGSPTRLVEELIRRAVGGEKKALEKPEPIILFDEFGDNSLNFEVHFWVRARSPMAMRDVQSRIRFRIDDLFREHDLVIAFPQRDVHLDSSSPIEVRLMEASPPPLAQEEAVA